MHFANDFYLKITLDLIVTTTVETKNSLIIIQCCRVEFPILIQSNFKFSHSLKLTIAKLQHSRKTIALAHKFLVNSRLCKQKWKRILQKYYLTSQKNERIATNFSLVWRTWITIEIALFLRNICLQSSCKRREDLPRWKVTHRIAHSSSDEEEMRSLAAIQLTTRCNSDYSHIFFSRAKNYSCTREYECWK